MEPLGENCQVRVLVTSIVRRAATSQASGFVRLLETRSGRILMKSHLPENTLRAYDPNPRGGLRGSRGVGICGERLAIANSERVFLYDRAWRPIASYSHPWLGAVHDLLAEPGGLWVTCTGADLLVHMDWEGHITERWEWRRDDALRRRFGLGKLPPVDLTRDFRDPESTRSGVNNVVHLNGVARGKGGLLLSFGRILSPRAYRRARIAGWVGKLARALGVPRRTRSQQNPEASPGGLADSSAAIVQVQPNGTGRVLFQTAGARVPNHNIVQIGNALVFNDSNRGEVVWRQANGREKRVRIPGERGFVRGLAHAGGSLFWVGSQHPAAVYQVNFHSCSVERHYDLEGLAEETVYGLCVVPEHFNDPPAALSSHRFGS